MASAGETAVNAIKPQSDEQVRVLIFLLILLALGAARSQAIRDFFKTAGTNAGASLSGHGASSTPQSTLDWHLFLYWGGAGIAAMLLSNVVPNVVNAILILVIIEELLVHWKDYAPLLSPPKK